MARRTYYFDIKFLLDNMSAADLLIGARTSIKMVELWKEQKRAMGVGDLMRVRECQTEMAQLLDAATIWKDISGMKAKKRQAYRRGKRLCEPHRISRLDERADLEPNLLVSVEADEADPIEAESQA